MSLVSSLASSLADGAAAVSRHCQLNVVLKG